eukprot:CAMPEP_0117438366 /NCGR_PEP_ID=MMETSP0759-20121206/2016_1 /TAXON_ID=63605 /ORGANISM="Percolomonas cosmopolitus, Strain WS" /LENGTH=615 /DNA_ID=CAMNT_0005230055 /DNA_START=195 /DNA_END=2042 /DNA_ORIENTATION=+
MAFVFEVVSYACMRRYGILGVWTSGAIIIMFLIMLVLIIGRRVLKWYKIRKWRQKGFVIGANGEYFAGMGANGDSKGHDKGRHGVSTPLLRSAVSLSRDDTRSSILTTNTSANLGLTDSESTRYGGLTVDMNPHSAQHRDEERKSNWFPFTSWWRKSDDKDRSARDTVTVDEDMSETTFTVKTPQSTPGFFYQTPSRRSSPTVDGHSLGSIYSMRSPAGPSSQGILRYHNQPSGGSRSHGSASSKSGGRRRRRRNPTSPTITLNTSHDLPIDEILQQSSFQSNISDHFSESSELLEYDTPPDEDIEMDSSHRRTPSSPSGVSKKLFDSPQSTQSKHSPSVTPIRTQFFSPHSSSRSRHSPQTPTSKIGSSFQTPKRSGKRRPVSRRLYSQSHSASPHIDEASYSNQRKKSIPSTADDEDSSVFASLTPMLLFGAAILLFNVVSGTNTSQQAQDDQFDLLQSTYGSDSSTETSRFPLPWPPQSVPDILAYVFAFVSNSFLFFARFPQIYHLWRKKSSEGISKMMFVCFILSNLCFSISVLLFVIDTMDVLAQLPFMIGTTFTLFLDGAILVLSAVYTKRYDDAALLDILSDYEDVDEEPVDFFDDVEEASREYSLN